MRPFDKVGGVFLALYSAILSVGFSLESGKWQWLSETNQSHTDVLEIFTNASLESTIPLQPLSTSKNHHDEHKWNYHPTIWLFGIFYFWDMELENVFF